MSWRVSPSLTHVRTERGLPTGQEASEGKRTVAEENPPVDARRQALMDDDTILRDTRCHGIVGEPTGARCGRESEFVVDGISVCAGHLAQTVRAQLVHGEDPSVVVMSSPPTVGH